MTLKRIIVFSVIGFVGLMVILVLIAATSSPSSKEQKVESPKAELKIGDTAIVNWHDEISDCSKSILIATTKESYEKVQKILLADDEMGIAEVLLSGEAFAVLNCTKVKIIDKATFIRQVRILEGEQLGKSGWVSYEFVKAQ